MTFEEYVAARLGRVTATRPALPDPPDGIEVWALLHRTDRDKPALPEMVRILDKLDFGPWPDMRWGGGR